MINPMVKVLHLLLHVIDGGGHGPVLGLGEQEGERGRDKGHGGEDECGDDRADLGQGGHGGRHGASDLGKMLEVRARYGRIRGHHRRLTNGKPN